MDDPADPVTIVFRIPGKWSKPKELVEALLPGCRLTPNTLFLPDNTTVDFGLRQPDNQFSKIFRSTCRNEPEPDELATVDGYKANVILSGPGGTLQSAHKMMEAAAAIVKAGGAGVFNDNSGLAHGGRNWLAMTEDGSPDALSFAFVSIVRGRTEVYTTGMHVLGLRDIVMKRTDVEVKGFDIIDVIRYLAAGEKPVEDGHIIADLDGPRFQVFKLESPNELAGSPMHNPFGRLELVSLGDVAEKN
ncbi:MAG: DUF4261 domain-containing protein [Planctomycetes bacterium]|nr:DUF4261 domain-containing protein [Planctomycetota bacterium]